jgi:hypothetical protein
MNGKSKYAAEVVIHTWLACHQQLLWITWDGILTSHPTFWNVWGRWEWEAFHWRASSLLFDFAMKEPLTFHSCFGPFDFALFAPNCPCPSCPSQGRVQIEVAMTREGGR